MGAPQRPTNELRKHKLRDPHSSDNDEIPRKTKVFEQFSEIRDYRQRTVKELIHFAGDEISAACNNPSRDCGSILRSMKGLVPAVEWMPKYNRKKLAADALAGLTVGVMLIPQSMAYALLAGLSPIYGMYSSSFVLIVFALFTTSKTLSVGPVATTAILISDAVSRYGLEDETPEYADLTITLCFISGVIQVLMGILRLGSVVKLLSRPVMSGFTTGAACIIAVNQCKDLFGLSFERTSLFSDTLANVFQNLPETELKTLGLSAFSMVVLLSVKYYPLKDRVPKWFPTPLILIIIGITLSYFLDFQSKGINVVGPVPSGLGAFVVPDLGLFMDLLPDALILSITSYMGSIALAETFATKDRDNVNANQELIAFGITCLFGSFNQSQTVSGSFSRSALNYDMGSKTQAHGIFTGLLMIFSLLLFTMVFEFLPKCILAAMILTSVRSLFDYKEIKYLYQTKRDDLIQFWVTVFVTLFIGIKEGIIAGVFVSSAMQIHRSVSPKMQTLGLLRDTGTYVDITRFPDAQTFPGVKIMSFSNRLFFGNGRNLKRKLTELARCKSNELEAVIIDAQRISSIDSTALRDLEDVLEECADNLLVVFAAVPGETRDVMERGGLKKFVGFETFFVSVHGAVQYTLAFLENQTEDVAKKSRYRISIASVDDRKIHYGDMDSDDQESETVQLVGYPPNTPRSKRAKRHSEHMITIKLDRDRAAGQSPRNPPDLDLRDGGHGSAHGSAYQSSRKLENDDANGDVVHGDAGDEGETSDSSGSESGSGSGSGSSD